MNKKETRFFTIADYEEEEQWLREQHRSGWKLVAMTPPCFYTFESCEPEDVIYRLDFKDPEENEGYMDMLKDFGWEYVGKCIGWLYFRKAAADVESQEEGELFSDNLSKVELVSQVIRFRMLPLCLIFFCCIIPNLLRFFHGEMQGPFNLFFGIFFAVMCVIYVFLITYCGTKLSRIRERYEDKNR